MALAILAALAGSAASSAGGGMANYYTNKMLARQEQSNYVKNQHMLQDISQSNQRNSAKNIVQGAKLAGLSPAIASAGNFSPAQMASAPLQSKQVNVQTPNLVEAMAVANQSKLIEAQTANIQADTDLKTIQAGRQGDEDAIIDVNIKNALIAQRDASTSPEEKQAYNNLLVSTAVFSKGSLEGLSEFKGFEQKLSDVNLKKFQNDFETRVLELKSSNEAAASLAAMPELERRQIIQGLSESLIRMYKMRSDVAVNEADIPKIKAETAKIATETKSIYHSDYNQLIDNDDYRAALVNIAKDVLKGVSAGAGFAAGSRVLGGGRGAAASHTRSASPRSSKMPQPEADDYYRNGGR